MNNSTNMKVFYLHAFADMRFKAIYFTLFLLVYLVTVIGNICIITLTELDHKLQTPMYFLLRNLAFLDICYTSTTLPQLLVNLLIEHLAISLPACVVQLFVFLSLAASESSLLATMAYDRYVAICHPLRYPVIMNRNICLYMVAGTWVIGGIYGAIHTINTFRLPFCGSNVLNHYFCDILPLLKISCIDTLPNEATVFAVGGFLMLGCFLLIFGSYVFDASSQSWDVTPSNCDSGTSNNVSALTPIAKVIYFKASIEQSYPSSLQIENWRLSSVSLSSKLRALYGANLLFFFVQLQTVV
ncbi:olfactory receptor 5V1-like [Engystomops pustulosus]|uniref:olfactory receptor 5V1-like n=1 Tax=Engystomops pustulosus TaxID=76066 RepID=UPI003AFAC63B